MAEQASFTRAADRLYVSQPALSQQIRKLERDLGYPLFHRDTREVRLTHEGEALLPSARAVIGAAELFEREARTLAGGPRRLTMGFRAQAANEWTPRILQRFAAVRPDVDVVLKQFPLSAVTAGLSTSESDVAIVRLPIDLAGLDHVPLLTEGRVVAVHEAHPLADRAGVTLADLDGQPWIVTAADDALWQRFARRPTVDGADAVLVDTVDEYLEAVVAGRAIGLAPASASRFYTRPGIRYVPVVDAEPSTIALAWRSDIATGNRTLADLVEVVRQLAQDVRGSEE